MTIQLNISALVPELPAGRGPGADIGAGRSAGPSLQSPDRSSATRSPAQPAGFGLALASQLVRKEPGQGQRSEAVAIPEPDFEAQVKIAVNDDTVVTPLSLQQGSEPTTEAASQLLNLETVSATTALENQTIQVETLPPELLKKLGAAPLNDLEINLKRLADQPVSGKTRTLFQDTNTPGVEVKISPLAASDAETVANNELLKPATSPTVRVISPAGSGPVSVEISLAQSLPQQVNAERSAVQSLTGSAPLPDDTVPVPPLTDPAIEGLPTRSAVPEHLTTVRSATELLRPGMPGSADPARSQPGDLPRAEPATPASRVSQSESVSIPDPTTRLSDQDSDVLLKSATRSPHAAAPVRQTAMPQMNADGEILLPGGKELPASGKELPSVLLQTPAAAAPGLASRTQFMTRDTGRQRTLGPKSDDLPGLDRLMGGPRAADLAARLLGQAAVPAPVREISGSPQSGATDAQAGSFFSQYLMGNEKPGGVRMAPLNGMETGSAFTLNLQAEGQAWNNQLAGRIRWMGNLNLSRAELKLHPAELGSLEILITTEDDQTRVNFITSTAAAKDLIETSMPRLRELLGQSGLLLEQSDVTHRDLQREQKPGTLATVEQSASGTAETAHKTTGFVPYGRSSGEHQVDHYV